MDSEQSQVKGVQVFDEIKAFGKLSFTCRYYAFGFYPEKMAVLSKDRKSEEKDLAAFTII